MSEPRYRCPACHDTGTLYENVEIDGWRALDEHGKPVPRHRRGIDHGAEWDHPRATGVVGCSCGWEGMRPEFEQVDSRGVPLPAIHPQQATLELGASS